MEKKMQEYARLLINVGVNIQKGQDLVIDCPVECAYFGRLCVEAAYDAGAHEVIICWQDDFVTRQKFLRAADDVFDSMHEWETSVYNVSARNGGAYLYISATDPDNMNGVAQDRLTRNLQCCYDSMKEFYDLEFANGIPWCIASIPIPSWATRVFPDCSEQEAMEKLWDAILYTVRVDGSGNAVELWRNHIAELTARTEQLDALHLVKMHYTNSLGSDFTLCLPEHHHWCCAHAVTPAGQDFVPNLPSEEVFGAPLKNSVNGVIYASKPLVVDGNVVEGLRFVVKDGKIIEATASTGQDALRAAISLDEGACYFGEMAFVPYDSPISNQGILYFNTLFDENAACHMAFGSAFPECLQGGSNMTTDDLTPMGLNSSATHVDFMIGTADLRVIGYTADGREIPLFVDGAFAI